MSSTARKPPRNRLEVPQQSEGVLLFASIASCSMLPRPCDGTHVGRGDTT
jgi:hypothetical protein